MGDDYLGHIRGRAVSVFVSVVSSGLLKLDQAHPQKQLLQEFFREAEDSLTLLLRTDDKLDGDDVREILALQSRLKLAANPRTKKYDSSVG